MSEPKPFKRSGLHRLECPMCPCYGYFTVAMLEHVIREDGALPECPARGCGETLVPATIGLALLLGVDDAPIMRAYLAKVSSVAHGQAHKGGDASKYESPEFRALYGSDKERGLLEEERLTALRRRLGGIGLQVVEVEREVPTKPGAKHATKTIRDLHVFKPTVEAIPF